MQNSKPIFALALLFTSAAISLTAADIKGTVVDSVSGIPVPRAHVKLIPEAGGKPVQYDAIAGADGGFSFSNVPAGTYETLADRTGYVNQDAMPEARVEISLTSDESKTGVTIKLTPTGSIAGRVTDSDGEPVEGAAVTANGGRSGVSGITDEKGQYRIGGLTPGKFRVQASHGNSSSHDKPEIRTDGTTEVHDAETYYPGVVAAREAGRIEVRAGTETPGADIQLVRAPFVRVSGRVVGLPKDIHASLRISRGNESDGEELRADGKFELWHLGPGKYGLSAEWQAPDGEQVQTANVPIEVANSNIDDIELRAVPPSDISGHLEFEDDDAKAATQPGNPPEGPPEQGQIELAGDPFGGGSSASIGSDGSFQLSKVRADQYHVRVLWGATWIKSMRLGSSVVDGSKLDLSNGSGGAELTVRLAAAKSSISGTVAGSSAERTGLAVALNSRSEPNETVECPIGADGSYSFDRLPPGSYRIGVVPEKDFSVQYDDESDDENPESFRTLSDAIELGANDKVTRDLKLPTPQ